MGRLSDWIIGIVFFLCVFAATMWSRADVIENDVQTRTQQELASKGYDWVQVDVDGRDITLKSGTQSPADNIALAALDNAEDVWGVRVVRDAIDRSVPTAEGVDQSDQIANTQSESTTAASDNESSESGDGLGNKSGDSGAQTITEISLPPLPVEPDPEPTVQLTNEQPKQSPAKAKQEPKQEPVKTVAVEPAIVSEPVLKIDDQTGKKDQKDTEAKPQIATAAPAKKAVEQDTGPLNPNECQDKIDIAVGGNVVRFGSGSSKINKQSFDLLNDIAAIARRCRTTRLEVAGHTDNTGTREANIRLSRLRAESVVTYLIGKGVGPNRLIAQGYGSANPVANNSNEAGRARNRRIDFNVRR